MRARSLLWLSLTILALVLGSSAGSAAQGASPRPALEGRFDLETLTYVSSRAGESDVVLSAEHAEYHPALDVVKLEGVDLRVSERPGVMGFQLRCGRGELQLAGGDFIGEDDVRGLTRDGRQLRTERLRYQHDQALVTTDAPVEIRDGGLATRGDGGFEYHVREARFRLLGGATLVQEP